jgi:hypothetical protein
MVLKKGKYIPHNYITKKRPIFRMKNIINHITQLNSFFYLYLGSQDTPPCEEYTYHLVVEKPIKIANCQLKVLRENSLAITDVKVVHSRLLQVNDPDEYDKDDKDDKNDKDDKDDKDDESNETSESSDNNMILGDKDRDEKVVILSKIFPHNDLFKYVPKESITKGNEYVEKKKKILNHHSNIITELNKKVNC